MTESIKFYLPDKQWGMFCNYYPSPITVHGLTYPTAEHYYQNRKFSDVTYCELIRQANTPHKSKLLGHQQVVKTGHPWRLAMTPVIEEHLARGVKSLPDWEEQKDQVMFEGVLAKFTQHPELQQVLLSTGKRELIEASPRDSYWGIGHDGEGANKLGKTLMKVRALLYTRAKRPMINSSDTR